MCPGVLPAASSLRRLYSRSLCRKLLPEPRQVLARRLSPRGTATHLLRLEINKHPRTC